MSEWREAIGSVRAPFLATRLAVPLIGLLAVYSIGYPPGEPRMRASKNELANLALRWDAGWYIAIARNGYYYNRNRSDRQFNIAFFPAYPLLIRAVRPIFGRRDASYLTAGVFISHVAFFGALVLLYALARSDLGDDDSARGAVVLLACYPFSVFHATAYTESLFLLAVLGAIVALRRHQWRYAIVAGLLAGLTRPNGFLLAATLATMAASTPMRQQLRDGKTRLAALAVIAAPVVGMALFSIYVGIETGNPFQWSAQHAAWGRSLEAARWSEPFTVIKEQGLGGYVSTLPLDFLNAVPTLLALALIVPVWRRFGPAYPVFLVTNLLPPLLTGGTMSMGRMTATMFPLFLWLATVRRISTTMLAIVFALLQGFIAVLFYTWRALN